MLQAVHKSGCLIDPSICEEYTNDEVGTNTCTNTVENPLQVFACSLTVTAILGYFAR